MKRNIMLTKPTEETQREMRFRWDAARGAYFISYSGKQLAVIHTDREGLFAFLDKRYSDIYPEYDEQNHTLAFFSGMYDARVDTQSDSFIFEVREITRDLPPPGVYRVGITNSGDLFMKPEQKSLSKIKTKIKTFDLKQDVQSFFTDKDTSGVRRNKKGTLLYGPPGNGKSSDIEDLKDYAADSKLYMISIDSDVAISTVSSICKSLKGEGIVLVMEELTERIGRRSLEELLNFLDGESSVDNCYTIATTNHPEQLPPNLVDRPSRFETFVEYKKPTKDQIVELGGLLGVSADEAGQLGGKDLSFDYVSFIFSKALQQSKSVASIYDEQQEHRRRISETFKGKIGF